MTHSYSKTIHRMFPSCRIEASAFRYVYSITSNV